MAKEVKLPATTPVPSNWVWAEMGRLTQTKSGYPFNSKQFSFERGSGKPLIRIRDVVRGYSETYTDEPCSDEYIIHRGNILIGMDGDFNVNKWASEDALLNQRVCLISSVSPYLVNDYLYYYLPMPLKQINAATPSVTVKHLSTKTLFKTPIPLPPLAEQQRIVTQIESLFQKLDSARDLVQSALDSFETRKAAILHKAFTGELIGAEPSIKPLGEISENIKIGPFGTMLHADDYVENGIPVINPKHMIQNTIQSQAKVTITSDKATELSQYLLEKNDIVMARRGEMGRTAYVTEKEHGWLCGTGSVRIRLPKDYNGLLYCLILSSQSTISFLEANAKGSTMKNLNEKIVAQIPVPDFCPNEQDEIVCILDSLLENEQKAKDLCDILDQIDLMKKAILARAFRGELGTNDPNEESAMELLKDVLAEAKNK